MKCRSGSLSSCNVAASHCVHAALLAPHFDVLWHTVGLPFHVQSSFSYFLMLRVKLCSQPRRLQKWDATQVLLQKHLSLWVHVSGSRLHMRHGSFSFSNLSLYFHILSHLEPGCTHRCGEHFCWLSHWTPNPLYLLLSTSFHPHTHKPSVSRSFLEHSAGWPKV